MSDEPRLPEVVNEIEFLNGHILASVVHITEGGKYGEYEYLNDAGERRWYRWARRHNDYGHRQFATLDECERYVLGEEL